MGLSDTYGKKLMQKNEYFADAFNGGLYHGNIEIDPQDLRELSTTELTILADGKRKSEFSQKFRDVLKEAVIKKDGKAYYLLLGIENQTNVNLAMPVRTYLYDALRYAKQVEDTSALHRKESKIKDSVKMSSTEFLSGWKYTDELKPVITLIVYYGTDEWDAPRSIHEMFSKEIDTEVLKYIPDYKINLIEPKKINDFNEFKTDFGKLMNVIAISDDKEKLKQESKNFNSIDNDIVRAINFYAGFDLKIPETGGTMKMAKGVADWREEIINEERVKLIATIDNMISELHLSLEKACQIANISVEDYERWKSSTANEK